LATAALLAAITSRTAVLPAIVADASKTTIEAVAE
jgi:hypothetical protein